MYLLDINVWLALTFDSHIQYSSAKTWFDGLPADVLCFFCRLTQQGFLRLASNRSVFGKAPAETRFFRKNRVSTFLSDPRVAYAEESAGLENHWRVFTQGHSFSPQVWNDCYLAAFALEGNLELVTFDKGFMHYANVSCTILS
jgi:toxin-antitoxin system PIN domain toxin